MAGKWKSSPNRPKQTVRAWPGLESLWVCYIIGLHLGCARIVLERERQKETTINPNENPAASPQATGRLPGADKPVLANSRPVGRVGVLGLWCRPEPSSSL